MNISFSDLTSEMTTDYEKDVVVTDLHVTAWAALDEKFHPEILSQKECSLSLIF